MLKNYLHVSYVHAISFLPTFKLTPLNLQALATVCTGIGYKMIVLIVKAFAGMSN